MIKEFFKKYWLAVFIFLEFVAFLIQKTDEAKIKPTQPAVQQQETETVQKQQNEPVQQQEKPLLISDELRKQLSETVPYAGMDVRYIDFTALGECAEITTKVPYSMRHAKKYIWRVGSYDVFYAYEYDDKGYIDKTVRRIPDAMWYPTDKEVAVKISGNNETELEQLYMPKFGPYYQGEPLTQQQIEELLDIQRQQEYEEYEAIMEERRQEMLNDSKFQKFFKEEWPDDSMEDAWNYYREYGYVIDDEFLDEFYGENE